MARETTRTTHRYLAGIGAGGALLACGLVAFFSLVGGAAVSVWPQSGGPDSLEVVELRPPGALVELSGAESLIASSDRLPAVTQGDPGDGSRDGPAEPPAESPSPPGGDAPFDPGAGAPPEFAVGGPQQGREGEGEGEGTEQQKSENDEEDCDDALLDHGDDDDEGGAWGERDREVAWTPVPAPDPMEPPAGLSFSSGPEEGHDDTSWTNTDG